MSETITLTFSLMQPDSGEEPLASFGWAEETRAVLDWFCYTKQLNSPDRTIIVRQVGHPAPLYKRFVSGSLP